MRPAFKIGDRVRYAVRDQSEGDPGTVVGVEVITTYNYIVEWDDDDPTDTYEQHQLSAEE